MKRRPFLRQAGIGMASLPLAMKPGTWTMANNAGWKAALQVLKTHCQIKSVPSLLCFQFMPELPAEVKSGEFNKADDNFYFYHDEQYCFRIFEKSHPSAGVVAMLIPCWAKQNDGSWKKIACLSQYELQALATACTEQPSLSSHDLLPVEKKQSLTPGVYCTKNGSVAMQSMLGADNDITCKMHVVANEALVLQSNYPIVTTGTV